MMTVVLLDILGDPPGRPCGQIVRIMAALTKKDPVAGALDHIKEGMISDYGSCGLVATALPGYATSEPRLNFISLFAAQ